MEVQPLAHFLARLEIGHALGVHRDRFASARIAADACIALSRRKGAEAAKFNSATLRQLVCDGNKDGAYDAFDLTLREVRKIGAKLLHQFRTDHCRPRVGIPAPNSPNATRSRLRRTLSPNFVRRKKDLRGAPK